jgi:DNA-binding IclR family transcriptional regulator
MAFQGIGETKRGTKADVGGIQSLHRAMTILQTVSGVRQGVGLSDLSKEVGLHSSTTFHLAKTLVSLGLMRQEAETKRYRLGPRLFSLASGALDELELLDIALPIMKGLAEETGESSHLAVGAGRDVTVIGRCDGSASIRLAERIGAARPSHATAIGKILLAAMSRDQLEAFVASGELKAFTPRTIVDRETLRRAIQRVVEEGVAFDDCEFDPEIRCLAAPVRDFRRRTVAAIGISAPIWRLGLTQVGESAERVKAAAARLSEQLGFPTSEKSAENGPETPR